MAIWVIITTCLLDSNIVGRDSKTRRSEYFSGISKILNKFQGCNIVIVENNSLLERPIHILKHKTFLDSFGVPVLYTRTNRIITRNYGMKELIDILECIKKFNIQDDDFIVKITGRYLLADDSPFINEIKRLEETQYDSIIRFGAYYNPPEAKSGNCITGLIGLRCKYVKEIEIPDEDTFVEEKWAKRIIELDDSKVCILQQLGIFIRPSGHEYYFAV